MRVISGQYKAKRLLSPKGTNTRPTLDRVKEALFSILQNDIVDATVLDLFSGTGNLGIESISRGAKFAYLNDVESASFSTILSNIKLTNMQKYAKISKKDYLKFLKKALNDNLKFDIIFLDPPYESNYGLISLEYISNNAPEILSKQGIIVYETDKSFIQKTAKDKMDFTNLECYDERIYGRVVIKLYRWR